ncbi:hypothetical protein ABEF95_010644 [Exophiala dermatitidis]
MARFKGIPELTTSTTPPGGPALSGVEGDLLDQETAKAILQHTLSLCTVDSAFDSSARSMNPARFGAIDDDAPLRDIGRGSCGSVFEIPGTGYAIKKGASTVAMWNDFNLTNCAANSYLMSLGLLEHAFPERRLPRVPMARYFNGPKADAFWRSHMTRFPRPDRKRAATFHLDHILPVPTRTREALVRRFFVDDEQTQRYVLNYPDNRDCLVRVYFGKNNPSNHLYDRTDTLRNFPLYLDQAKEIGIDIDALAEEMAMGLAVLHWKAGIDAQDTEFVIGSSTTKAFGTVFSDHTSQEPPVSTMDDLTQREVQLWMLDYDKASKFDIEKMQPFTLLERYLVAVTGNDPYFPHPVLDVALWRVFRNAYVEASQIILYAQGCYESIVLALPAMLIDEWEDWGALDADADKFDPFERGVDADDADEEEDDEDDEDEEEDYDDESDDEHRL